MELGIFGLPSGKMTFMEAVDYAKEAGIDALEPYPHAEFAQPTDEAVEKAKELKAYAAEKGIKINCFSMGINITTGDTIAANIERLKGYARVAAAMGSPFLHHTLMPQLVSNFTSNIKFDEFLSRAVKGITEVYDYAASVGVEAVYEDQGFTFNGGERFERLLNAVDRDIKVVADLGNIMFVDEDPVDFVGRFAPHIVHVHVKDYIRKSAYGNDPGKDGGWYTTRRGDYLRGTIVGHGSIDYVACCKILISAGYTGSFSLEYCGLEEGLSGRIQSMRNFRRYYAQAEAELGKGSVSAVPFT